MTLSIQDTIRQLHSSLRDYIEATYHISAPGLIEQRKELLDRPAVIHQIPYLESTPRYQSGETYFAIQDLSPAALQIYKILSTAEGSFPSLIYDPPYKHQSDAIRHNLVDGKNLLIMTGTGSGKTEAFLLPILGKLAHEAHSSPQAFRDQSAVRALILYPMNALVNDKLGRLRSLFGDPRVVAQFKTWAQRPPRFARYTSRTPYAGVRTRDKDSRKLKAFDDFYVEIQRQAEGPASGEQEKAKTLLDQLKARGKWPAKPDLPAWFGDKGSDWQDRRTKEFRRAVTLPDDVELVTRHEVQSAPPDLLVTNYSMLEYMLMRSHRETDLRSDPRLAEPKSGRKILDRSRRGTPLQRRRRRGSRPIAATLARSLKYSSRAVPGHLRDRELQRSKIRTAIWRTARRRPCRHIHIDSRRVRVATPCGTRDKTRCRGPGGH